MNPDVLVLFEHPEWQKPLFAALEARGVRYAALDLKRAAFEPGGAPPAKVVFNQASPSAYVRGNARAVPFALAYLKALEHADVKVLNGARAFALELSKTEQIALVRSLGLDAPRSITFNDAATLAERVPAGWRWPALLKPEQGGSGARIEKVASVDEIRALLDARPELWQPDGLFLLQELVEHDVERGIVRLEFLGGELLYAMRVVSHGRFNLCPSEVCNPHAGPSAPVEFFAYPDVPRRAVEAAQRIVRRAGIDVGGIELIEAGDRFVFYDINANSNLRRSIARETGVEPFERVVDFLVRQLG